MQKTINHPNKYPFVLFHVMNTTTNNQMFCLATSYFSAKEKARDFFNQEQYNGLIAEPVMVCHLIKEFKHAKTHEILKRFGNEWMTKDGMAFFKKDV